MWSIFPSSLVFEKVYAYKFTEHKIIMGHWKFPKKSAQDPLATPNVERDIMMTSSIPSYYGPGCFLVQNSKTIPFHVGYIYLHVLR